jgi:small acid-soluble spore protein (thioredoxin-like protein)
MKKTKNPDNSENNRELLKLKFNKTMHNSEIADDLINKTNDDRLKETLKDKNVRRKAAANFMRREFRDK